MFYTVTVTVRGLKVVHFLTSILLPLALSSWIQSLDATVTRSFRQRKSFSCRVNMCLDTWGSSDIIQRN